MHRLLPVVALALVSCSGEEPAPDGNAQATATAPASPTRSAPRTPTLDASPQPVETPEWLDRSPAPDNATMVHRPAADKSSWPGPTGIAPRLQPISFAEIEKADLLGAGCTWSKRGDRAVLFVAVSDRAAYKMGGEVVDITAGAGAPRLSLGAAARFIGEGIGFVIVPSGKPAKSGYETVAQPATLEVGADGIDPTPIPGTLNCGS